MEKEPRVNLQIVLEAQQAGQGEEEGVEGAGGHENGGDVDGGVPQLFILIVLIVFSSFTDSCFRLLEGDDPATITFLVLSLLQTFMTIILATIGSINIRKGGQLDVKSKIVLGLSVSCQLMARLWTMVLIASAVIVPSKIFYDTNPISLTSTIILLVLPIPIFWVSTLLLHAWLNTDFYLLSPKNTLIHLLSSTWITVPVMQMEERDQKHKGRELFFELLLAGINLVGTSAALAITIGAKLVDALLFLILPPLFLHLAGCGLMLLFEKTVHPWRDLGKERERHCWGKLQGTARGIKAEPTLWEEVSVTLDKLQCSLELSQGGKEKSEVEQQPKEVALSLCFQLFVLMNIVIMIPFL